MNTTYWHIPVSLKVLDAATYRCLGQCFVRDQLQFKREETIPDALVVYYLHRLDLGDLGKIEFARTGDNTCNLSIRNPSKVTIEEIATAGGADTPEERYQRKRDCQDHIIRRYFIYLKDEEIWHYDMVNVFDEELMVAPDVLVEIVRQFFEGRNSWPKVFVGGDPQEISLQAVPTRDGLGIEMCRHTNMGNFKSLLGLVSFQMNGMKCRVFIRMLSSPSIPLPGFIDICRKLGEHISNASAAQTATMPETGNIADDNLVRTLAARDKPVDRSSCFISYSSKDQDFAERLHADLQGEGIRVWFAAEDLKIGDKFRTRIDEAIRVYDKLMVVLSENSIHSAWVEDEVEAALERERQQHRTVLFPVRLDDYVMTTTQAWAASIRRTRHIGDFSKWKEHDEYQKAFSRLLRDLQADDTKT